MNSNFTSEHMQKIKEILINTLAKEKNENYEKKKEKLKDINKYIDGFYDQGVAKLTPTFRKLDIKEVFTIYSHGYEGYVLSNELDELYDVKDGILHLVNVKTGERAPVAASIELMTATFSTVEVPEFIENSEAVRLMTEGVQLKFKLEKCGNVFTGYCRLEGDVPTFSVYGTHGTGWKKEDVLILAILTGKWYQ